MSSERDEEPLASMRDVNRRQGEYYERSYVAQAGAGEPRGIRRAATGVWTRFRRGVGESVRSAIGLHEEVEALHLQWMGDLTGKRVLDLGCYSGNPLSVRIARESGAYLGVDLSRSAIAILGRKLEGISHAEVEAVDFLDEDYPWGRFDVIYARGVLHHFKHAETLCELLLDRLVRDGVVVTHDPMETSVPVRIARRLYRPLQMDADWEWPFDRSTLAVFQRYFEIDQIKGLLGRAKYAIPLWFVNERLATRLGRRWHARDMADATSMNRHLFSCMQVAMRLRRPARQAVSRRDG